MRKECAILCLIALMTVLFGVSDARYLPTRSQDDRLLRLRQLIKDLLDNDADPMEHPIPLFEPRLYNREPMGYERPMQYLH